MMNAMLLAGGLLALASVLMIALHRRRRKHALRAGLCLWCGYGRISNVERCPECGMTLAESTRSGRRKWRLARRACIASSGLCFAVAYVLSWHWAPWSSNRVLLAAVQVAGPGTPAGRELLLRTESATGNTDAAGRQLVRFTRTLLDPSETPKTRVFAVYMLNRLEKWTDVPSDLVVVALRDQESEVRRNAVIAVAMSANSNDRRLWRDQDQILHELRRLLQDPAWNVRGTAAASIGQLRWQGAAAVRDIALMKTTDPNQFCRDDAASALHKIGVAAEYEQAILDIASQDRSSRVAALRVLLACRHPWVLKYLVTECVSVLREALSDSEAREQAKSTSAAFLKSSEPEIVKLAEHLDELLSQSPIDSK